MVINIGALKDKRFNDVKEDIESVVTAANGKTVKVIIETVLLSNEEKVKACELAKKLVHTLLKHQQDLLVVVLQLKTLS